MYHDLDFSVLPHILRSDSLIIDVGANKGQSIRSIKNGLPHSIIYSFEPNPALKPQLQELQDKYSDIFLHFNGLGNCEKIATFYIPTVQGKMYVEEATMRLESLNSPWIVENS